MAIQECQSSVVTNWKPFELLNGTVTPRCSDNRVISVSRYLSHRGAKSDSLAQNHD